MKKTLEVTACESLSSFVVEKLIYNPITINSAEKKKMEILDTYEELIESDSNDISICWKIFQVFFYLLSATSGYGAAILFYILWYNIFAGHCPLWAQIIMPTQPRRNAEDIQFEEVPEIHELDWRQKILVSSQYSNHCNLYHSVSLASCVFGITWLILFAMCGKGGYDTRIFVAPWRVVPIALIFQFIFSILTVVVVYDMDYGYLKFANSLQKYTSHLNATELPERDRQCDIVQNYIDIYGPNRPSVCLVYPILQIVSWIMAWSWIFGFIVLLLRVISMIDFKLFRIVVQEIPKDQQQEYAKKKRSAESEDSVRIPKKKTRLCTLCCASPMKED